jgi:hypothetical protein
MRAVSFGKVTVAAAGTPVNLGVSTTNGALAAGATSLVVASAIPFSPDMLTPSFVLTLDTGVNQEKVTVTGVNGATFTISPCALPHLTGVAVRADDFRIAGFIASANVSNVGSAFLGNRNMATGGSAGTIRRFCVTASGGADDTLSVMLNSQDGDPGLITEFTIDVATSGDGLNFTCWVR